MSVKLGQRLGMGKNKDISGFSRMEINDMGLFFQSDAEFSPFLLWHQQLRYLCFRT